MLSVPQCRKYLNNQTLSDVEVAQIRDLLQGVAELSIKALNDKKCYNDSATQRAGDAISFNRIQKRGNRVSCVAT
jgi:hypothetical protein